MVILSSQMFLLQECITGNKDRGILILMKYTAAVLIALFSLLILSCGADSSDAEQESVAEVASELDTVPVESAIEPVNAIDEPGESASQPGADDNKADHLPAEAVASDEELFLIENGHAGLFEVGMSSEAIENIAQAYEDIEFEEADIMLEGTPAPVIRITLPRETSEALVLELDGEDAAVFRIRVNSERFVTDKGIGTASTFSELQANYEFEGVFWGDGGNPLIIIEELEASVLLEPGDWWVMGEVEGEIPPDTKISAILIL